MTTGGGTLVPTTATARTSMADLISILRGLTNTGLTDYSVSGATYWTDAQLQTVMDRHVYPVRYEPMTPMPTIGLSGTAAYYDYQSPRRFFETTNGGTARFVVQDETGATIGTAAYTADYPSGRVTFGTDTTGSTRYVTGYSYDLNACAADVWTQKAAHYVTAYDFSTDNHNLRRSQIIANCMLMAKDYAAGQAVHNMSIERGDTSGYVTDED